MQAPNEIDLSVAMLQSENRSMDFHGSMYRGILWNIVESFQSSGRSETDRQLTRRSACFHVKHKWLNVCWVKGVCNKHKVREKWKAHFVPDNNFPLSLAHTSIDVHKEMPHILLPTCISNSHNKNNNNNNDNNIQRESLLN